VQGFSNGSRQRASLSLLDNWGSSCEKHFHARDKSRRHGFCVDSRRTFPVICPPAWCLWSGPQMLNQGEGKTFSRHKAGVLASVASLTLLQIGNAVAIGLIGSIGPAGATVLRIGIAALLTLPLIFLMKSSARVPGRFILKYGLVLGLMQVTFYQAISTIDLSLAVSIEFTVPLVIGCIRSRNKTARVSAALAVAGLFMIPAYNSTTAIEGMLYAVATGLLLSTYIHVGTSMPADNHPVLTLSRGLWVALPVSVVAFAVAPHHAVPLTAELGLHAFIVSVLTLLAPFALELFAMKRLRGLVFALIAALDPALASAVGAVALHQSLDLRQVTGIVLLTICASVAVYAESSTSSEKVSVQ